MPIYDRLRSMMMMVLIANHSSILVSITIPVGHVIIHTMDTEKRNV